MGCDIHMYVERLEYEDESEDGVRRWTCIATEDATYTNRNYFLFAVLASVRNYDEIKPISEPRGLPEDVSKQVADAINNVDYHSKTWLTLQEIRNYFRKKDSAEQTIGGIISPIEAYRLYEKKENPNNWNRGTSVKMVSEKEMRALVKKHEKILAPLSEKPNFFMSKLFSELELQKELAVETKATWTIRTADGCSTFIAWLDMMEEIAHWEMHRGEIRFVFAFDN